MLRRFTTEGIRLMESQDIEGYCKHSPIDELNLWQSEQVWDDERNVVKSGGTPFCTACKRFLKWICGG